MIKPVIRRASLGRKIAVRMALVTLSGLIISALCTFFLYSWVFQNHPNAVAGPEDWIPQAVDYLALAASFALAIGIAVVAGRQLARRIVLPLTSLGETARRIADGDLSARAAVGDRSLGETAILVDDFNRMAERLEGLAKAMVTWNASIAHELRTPVTILKGRLQGVSDGVFQMDGETLSSLLKQVDGLARLVEDLRVVSLADSGHLHLHWQVADLAEVLGDLRMAVDPVLIAAGFRPDWTLDAGRVACDPVRLRQAVLALIENARCHATPGDLTIRAVFQDQVARISVEDTGPGLSPDFEGRAFEPFQRDTVHRSGSGLGLSVVRVIATAHDGRATYRPHPQGGSIFELEIPTTQVRQPDFEI